VLLADDCSSMNEGTKWSDVKCIVEQVVGMVSNCNKNRTASGICAQECTRALGVTSSGDLQLLFDGMQPQGSTPFIQPLAAKVLDPFYACCRRRRGATLEKLAVAYTCETTFYYMIGASAGKMRAGKQGGGAALLLAVVALSVIAAVVSAREGGECVVSDSAA
jgi:hypothetical protein